MKIVVHTDTLKIVGQRTVGKFTYNTQTIEVSIGDDRRAVRCFEHDDTITICGLAVRFLNGNKVWPGRAIYWRKTGFVNNLRANIDKNGFFKLVGFETDFDGKTVRSQHNAVAA